MNNESLARTHIINNESARYFFFLTLQSGLPLLGYEVESKPVGGGVDESPASLRAGLGVATVEKLISRMLTGMMEAYAERDDPERVFRYCDSLASLDAACLSLLG